MKDKTAPTICGLYLEISTLCLMLDRFIKFHFMKVVRQSNTESRRFGLDPDFC